VKRIRRSLAALRQPRPETGPPRTSRRKVPSEFVDGEPLEHFSADQIEKRIEKAIQQTKKGAPKSAREEIDDDRSLPDHS